MGPGLLAEKVFGFSGNLGAGVTAADAQAGDAAALSSSLLVCLVVPWSLCLIFYCGEAHQRIAGTQTPVPTHMPSSHARVKLTAACIQSSACDAA